MPAFASSLDSAQSVVNTQVNFEDHAVESQKQIGTERGGRARVTSPGQGSLAHI